MLSRGHALEMLRGVGGTLSSKRVLTNRAVWAFVFSMVSMTVAICYRISTKGDIGMGAVAAYTALTVPLAGLMVAVFRKAPDAVPNDKQIG